MINKPKGTFDLTPDVIKKWHKVEEILHSISMLYNYQEIRTPIFEKSELFHRSVGEGSDIVAKETYDFIDRAKRSMTLRPEGTAAVVRSIIENKLHANASLPLKYYYIGPMFRYERPQKGRQRQFTQFGLEAIGVNDPRLDVEIIQMAVHIFNLIGIKGVKVRINSIGDEESRENYKEVLRKHIETKKDTLCGDCQRRIDTNILRVLDCKVDKDNELLTSAPKIVDHLNEASNSYFKEVCHLLDTLEIDYEVDSNLVRGLDYYTHTVFEVDGEIEGFGSNNVLGAGGRYNDLVKNLEGPDLPCVGMAFGMERILLAIELEKIDLGVDNTIDVFVIGLGESTKDYSYFLTNVLRINGFTTETDYSNKSLKAQFKQSDKLNAKAVIIIGETEVENKVVNIKINGQEETVKFDDIIPYLDKKLEE